MNKLLTLALGIAVGVIFMLLRERQAEPPVELPEPQSSSTLSDLSVLPDPTPVENAAAPVAIVPDKPEVAEVDTAAFEEEMRRVLQGEATEDEQLAFWQSVQNDKRLDALIDDLQQTADDDPRDVETRLGLARALITKLRGTPAGPAQGLLAGKAQEAWQEVLEVDSQNWEAQHSMGFSYSQYPDFLNMTGNAIREYEKTLAIQESSQEPQLRYSRSYLELARLHLKNGDPSNALATLERGVANHPDDAALNAQLSTVSSSYKFEDPPSQDAQ